MNDCIWIDVIRQCLQNQNLCLETSGIEVIPVSSKAMVNDATQKFLIRNLSRKPIGFALCSTAVAPQMVQRLCDKTKNVFSVLPNDMLRHLSYPPIAQSNNKGLTFAIFPFFYRLSDNRMIWTIQRFRLSSAVLDFLFQLAQSTQSSPQHIIKEYLMSLEFISTDQQLPVEMRDHANMALNRIKNNKWIPRFILMHGDLWKGNIMLKSNSWSDFLWPKDFVLIDWAGSQVFGYPIFDLMRAADSLKTSKTMLINECNRHAQVLECSLFDVRSYLIAALGHYGRNREEFPYKRWLEMAISCDKRLTSAVKI